MATYSARQVASRSNLEPKRPQKGANARVVSLFADCQDNLPAASSGLEWS